MTVKNTLALSYHLKPFAAHGSRMLYYPVDAELQAGIFNNGSKSTLVMLKHCAVCGKPLASNANKVKYCPKCSKSIKAKQKLAYKHRIRGEK